MTELGFIIENRAGTDVLVYDDGSCHPATPDEVALWAELEAEREAFARYRDAAEQAAREDAARTMRAEAERDRLAAAVEAVRADDTFATASWSNEEFKAGLRAAQMQVGIVLDKHLGEG